MIPQKLTSLMPSYFALVCCLAHAAVLFKKRNRALDFPMLGAAIL